MKNKDLPAMPIPLNDGQSFSYHGEADGLTKREMFAKEALQGLLANKYTGDPANWDSPQEWVKQISEAAVEFADATLDELERTGGADMMLEGEK